MQPPATAIVPATSAVAQKKKNTQNQKTQTRKEKHLTTVNSKEYKEMQSSTRLVSGTVI